MSPDRSDHISDGDLAKLLNDTFARQSRSLPALELRAESIACGTPNRSRVAGNGGDLGASDRLRVLHARSRTGHGRQRLALVGLAAATLVALIGAVTLIRDPDRTATLPPASEAAEDGAPSSNSADPATLPNQWNTPTVRAAAESMTILLLRRQRHVVGGRDPSLQRSPCRRLAELGG